MKIYDCFMYFDEDLVLELRLNTLDKYVDYFVIVESNYNHKGDKRELRFNIDKFKKFKNKILYLNYNFTPEGIEIISEKESENSKSAKFILNAARRENGQRNYIEKARLNVNDLIKKRQEEKKIDKKTNILIFSGATAIAVVALAVVIL